MRSSITWQYFGSLLSTKCFEKIWNCKVMSKIINMFTKYQTLYGHCCSFHEHSGSIHWESIFDCGMDFFFFLKLDWLTYSSNTPIWLIWLIFGFCLGFTNNTFFHQTVIDHIWLADRNWTIVCGGCRVCWTISIKLALGIKRLQMIKQCKISQQQNISNDIEVTKMY